MPDSGVRGGLSRSRRGKLALTAAVILVAVIWAVQARRSRAEIAGADERGDTTCIAAKIGLSCR